MKHEDFAARLKATAKQRRGYTVTDLDRAFRQRCREIGMLGSCLCAFPVVVVPTPSGHEPWCPATGLFESFERIDASQAVE